MTFSEHFKSLLCGVALGATVSALIVLYVARLSSPLWVSEEDLRRSVELERRARKAYAAGAAEDALTSIRAAKMFREMRPSMTRDMWPMTFPVLPLQLSLGGIDREEFGGHPKQDPTGMIYGCAEIHLLMQRQMDMDAQARVTDLKMKYPNVDAKWCAGIADAFFKAID